MATTENQEKEVVKIPVAKRNKLLQDITEQVKGIQIGDSFEVAGHEYYMTTLTSDEAVWADNYCNLSSEVSAFSSMRAPRLAASIKRIDGIPVENLFEFSEESTKEDIAYHTGSQYRKRYWVMNQMLLVLGDMPDKIIIEMWTHYTELIKRRDQSWDKLKKSSTRTQCGVSKDTSSPAKESSLATQTSNA